MESWRFFEAAKELLEPAEIHDIYRKTTRTFNRYAADPRFCGERRRNPIQRTRMLLTVLATKGPAGVSVARAIIDYQAEAIGGRFERSDVPRSDKGTIEGEIADIVRALGDLTQEIDEALEDEVLEPKEVDRIREASRRLHRQVDELVDAAGAGFVAEEED